MGFNLVDDKFLSVLMRDGSLEVVSLDEAFARSGEIVTFQGDIADRVMGVSLLTSVAQTALGKIPDINKWTGCRDRIVSESRAYLQKKRDRFNLYGPTPFGQNTTLSGWDRKRTSRFSLKRPSGDGSGFADPLAATYVPSDAELPLMFLGFQAFNAGGLLRVPDLWTGKMITRAEPGPLAGKLLVVHEGESLLDTIWLHLVTTDMLGGWNLGSPFWERKFLTREDYQDYANSYFGCVLPMPMAAFLHNNEEASWTEVVKYDKVVPHPMAIQIVTRENKSITRGIAFDTEVWRQVVAALTASEHGRKPWASEHVTHYGGKLFIYAGGVPKKEAKQHSPTESVFCLESGKSQTAWESRLIGNFRLASTAEWRMRAAIAVYLKTVLQCNDLKRDKSSRAKLPDMAEKIYWAKLHMGNALLFRASAGEPGYSKRWHKMCWRTANDTYEKLAVTNSGRSFEAFAMGLGEFRRVDGKSNGRIGRSPMKCRTEILSASEIVHSDAERIVRHVIMLMKVDDPIPCTVLDPFCGSGTTGLVSLKHGRRFIGVDIRPEYVALATARLAGKKQASEGDRL